MICEKTNQEKKKRPINTLTILLTKQIPIQLFKKTIIKQPKKYVSKQPINTPINLCTYYPANQLNTNPTTQTTDQLANQLINQPPNHQLNIPLTIHLTK